MGGERRGEGGRGRAQCYVLTVRQPMFLRALGPVDNGLRGAMVRCKSLIVIVGHVNLGRGAVASPSKFFHHPFVTHCGRSPVHFYDRGGQPLGVLVRRVHL